MKIELEKAVTKSELIAAMEEFPDSAQIIIYNSNGGAYVPSLIEYDEDNNLIEIKLG